MPPRLCPTKNVSSSGTLTAFAIVFTHVSRLGFSGLGMASTRASTGHIRSWALSHGNQLELGLLFQPCTIKTLFMTLRLINLKGIYQMYLRSTTLRSIVDD